MKRFHPLLLSVLSGLLLWAAWPMSPLTLLIFAGFVPLLWLEHQGIGRRRFFYAVYLAMLLWNIGTTWWVCHASLPGGIVAMLFSSGFMSLPWIGYHFIKKRLGQQWGFAALIAFWLAFEFTYLNIQLSWPWLTLGNVFAMHPDWVQWYEYTGSGGGSLWVLLLNIFIFKMLSTAVSIRTIFSNRSFIVSIVLLVLPLLASFMAGLHMFPPKGGKSEVVVVQPNIDPYEKFSAGSQTQQLADLIALSESQTDSSTRLVVWPETALSGVNGFNESKLKEYPSLVPLWEFLKKHPQLSLFTGVEGYTVYNEDNKTPLSRKIRGTNQYVDVFNSATILTADSNRATRSADSAFAISPNVPQSAGIADHIIFYHKSKLVPGVETLPTYLRFVDSWFEQFGGTSGGYASQEERTVLEDKKSGLKIAPAICYESIYGEFLTAYIRNGANVISIITNDGWWENTAGHRQHMQYARLRAIETRRWIIRSANTGISCFIDNYGNIYNPQPWDTKASIKMNIPAATQLTFFVKHGDIISRIAFGAAGILLICGIAFRNKKYAANNSL